MVYYAKHMKKILIALFVTLGIAIVAALICFWEVTHGTFSAASVVASGISVSSSTISFSVVSESSALGYTGYSVQQKGTSLYIALHSTLFDTPFSRVRAFDTSIPNQYGHIDRIYLRGGGIDSLIWANGKSVK